MNGRGDWVPSSGSVAPAKPEEASATELPRMGLVHMEGAAIRSAWGTGVTPSNEG